ncbi:Ubiquinone biosynthesis O-methyltransferase, mitochondrial [subsurface metagenome]
MFFGRECYRYPEILWQMLGETKVETKASSRWWQPFIKAYIYLLGLPHVGYQLRASYFRRAIRQFKFNRALDAGCGIGLYSFYLGKKNPWAMIDACDSNSGYIEAGKRILNQLKLSNVNIFQADLSQLSEIDKYDLIIGIDVLEHIEDDGQVLTNFHRALKDGGILYLTTPHVRHTKRYFQSLRHESKGHIRAGYTEQGLTKLLQDNGFRVNKVRNVWGFFGEGCEELYMLAILRLPLPFASLLFPLLSIISSLDMLTRNSKGYGLLLIAQKERNWSGSQ